MTETIRATAVQACEDFVIRVTFSNDDVKDIDLSSDLSNARGVFVPLRDPQVLPEVRINELSGTVEWPGEVDLDTEVLYGRFEPAAGPPLTRRTVREPQAAARSQRTPRRDVGPSAPRPASWRSHDEASP